MLEQCHDDDFNVMNSLHFAIKSGNPEMVKQVYQCLPVLLFTMDNDGNSPLDVAIEQNRVQEFNILMELVVNNALKLPQLFKTWAIKIINLHKSNIFRNNNVVVENVLTNTINAMDMNPKEKTVQYWAIKLAKSMLGYYNSNEHLINIWEQIAINTLFHFPDESPIVKQCIGYVVEIFDHKLSAEPKYNIEYELESILKRCARYSHPSVILEKLNIALKNKIEYEHWIKRITHHAKYAIDTFRDDPLIQPYASKLMYYLKKSESNSSVNDPFPQTFLKIVPSASKEFQLTSSKPMKSEETDNKIKCDWLTYLVKIPFLPYNSKLRNEEVHAIRELISAIQEDRKDNILQIMDSFKTDSKDELLAMAATYLNDQHFKIPKEVAKFINTTLLTYRFYTNYTIPIPPKSNLLESEKEGRLEYLIQQMNIILEWPGSNNQVLMYHIKQVIFHADYVEFWHRSVLPELPWIQLKFYLQQYIKYFTSKDEIHLYQIGLISQKELTKIINLFRTMLLCVKNKKDSSKIKLTSEDKTIIEEFKKIYHEIRDVYVLYRICHYVESNEKKNGLTILRIVQVIGKCLKNSDKTPNVSDCLLEHIKEYFFEEEIAGIIRLSDNISHLTSIPNCTERIQTIFDKTLNDISKCFIHIKINYIYKECNDRIKKFIKGPTEIGDLPNFYKVTHKNLIDDILSREPSKQKRSKIQHNINIHLLQSVITSEGENIPEYKDDLMQLRKLQNKTNGYMEMELILMIILNNLNKKQKRLNNNLEWFKEMYPTLTGQQLRNHLAHGDPIVELLRIDEEVAVRDTAKLLTAEIANSSKFVIQKITKALKLDQMEEININQRNKIEQMENLFEYIIEGNLERVKTLLDNIQDKWVDWCDKNEHNVLEITAQNKKDNVKLFEFVLNQNSNFMNDINKYGNSILQIASMAGNTNITKYILEKNIMALYEQEKLPRISESITDVNKLLTELIKTTRTIKPKQQNAWNAIAQYVICLNNEDTIKSVTKLFYYSLLDCPLDNNLNTYLHIACIHGAEKVVQYLIKIGYNLNCRNIHKDTPLSLAIHHKRDNIIRLLLNKGAIVFNVNNITESIKILFNAPNYDEHEQLWDIIKSGKVEDLNENMIAPSRLEDGRNCLHFAVESNNSVMIQRIYDEYPHLLVTYDLQLITPLNLVISKNNESLHKCILDLVFKEYRGNEIVQSELFKNVVKTLMKTSNDKIAEVVMNKILDVVNMYPDDKFFNYWIINLVNHYFKTINEYGTDKVKICLNLVKNGIRNFTEKQIIEQCICLFVNIFINNSQWENNHISDTFNYLLEEGKNKNRLFILECLNNQFDSANLENISDFKYELISKYSYIVHAIRNKESVSKIQ